MDPYDWVELNSYQFELNPSFKTLILDKLVDRIKKIDQQKVL